MCDFNWTSARVALPSPRVLFFECCRQVCRQDEKAKAVVGPSSARVRASKSGIEHLGYRSVCLNASRCIGAGGCLKDHVFVSRTHQKRALVYQWRSFRVVQHVVPPDSLIRPLEVRHCSGVCCVSC